MHNYQSADVCDNAKILIFQQITTQFLLHHGEVMMSVTMQRY